MSLSAAGPFDVNMNAEPSYEAATGGNVLGRVSFSKRFHGALDATSVVQMLSAGTAVKGSAGYVAIELVDGRLGGREGTFVLQHNGTMNRGAASLTVTVVPDSGTGALAGVHARLAAKGRPPYRLVDTAHIHPTHDLGALAASHLEAARTGRPFSFARVLSALFQDDTGTTGDAASFLLFDGKYAETLMEGGRRDAEAAHEELAKL